jgi:hypothetical protein
MHCDMKRIDTSVVKEMLIVRLQLRKSTLYFFMVKSQENRGFFAGLFYLLFIFIFSKILARYADKYYRCEGGHKGVSATQFCVNYHIIYLWVSYFVGVKSGKTPPLTQGVAFQERKEKRRREEKRIIEKGSVGSQRSLNK